MIQKLYRMLEMNFEGEPERDPIREFARTGVYDFVEDSMESKSNSEDDFLSRQDEVHSKKKKFFYRTLKGSSP